jgi:Carboxypeptidase regulatory-like domain
MLLEEDALRSINRFVTSACVIAAMVVVLFNATPGAQTSTSISGTVVDAAGGVIPGAAVVATNASGVSFESLTNAEGVFNIPSIAAGKYNVTVTLAGFKTAVVEVSVLPNTPATAKVVLELGQLNETITVQSSSELINTQTATVASTLNADQLNRMPTPTRNALNAVTFLPGVNTATTNRESRINGLPESFIYITLDGVSNSDNFNRSSDSFFANVTPRQDAVEAVSVVTAVGGATVGGSGAVSINFQTRSGTNRFSGTAYDYFRHPDLNTNYWFNERSDLPKNDIKLYQYGFRVGGPIVVPGLYDGHGKAFYMVHYEQLRFPNSFTRTRTVLHPRALQGFFRYSVGNDTREVNVLDLARANNQIATTDPLAMSVLNRISSAMQTTGAVNATSDPLLNDYVWLSPGKLFEHQPTVKLDYNLTDKHRLSGSYQVIWAERDPDYLNNGDIRFPGGQNYSFYHRRSPITAMALRSTLSRNITNELRVGITSKGGASYFGDPASNGPQTFADQDGYAIDFGTTNDLDLTNWHVENGPTWRSAPTYSIDNALTWQKGTHSLSAGGGVLFASAWERAQQIVPGISIGFSTNNDPAAGLFTAASGNFPNASTGQLTDARQLYAILTGRVLSVTGQAALDPVTNTYRAFEARTREGKINMYSSYIQDQWRTTPTLTITGGLRWDVQLPFTAVNDVMSTVTLADICGISGLGPGGTYSKCNFFAPGATGGKTPEYIALTKGNGGYNTDWNNFAPSAQVAWRPNVEHGFMRKLLGDPEQATLRAGYSVAYERQGMAVFTGVFGPNPGSVLSLTRGENTGLVPPGQTWPVLLSQRDRLYNAPFPESPTYPIQVRPNRADNMNGFAPDVKIASAHTWTVSFQRSLSRDMAVEARYVGTYGMNQWSTLNYNQIRGENLINNGFLKEFRLAMQNLQANNASGVSSRSGSFAYFGPGTGTNPLPIYLAYLAGRTDAGNPTAYTTNVANTWQNATLAGRLVQASPSPVNAAADLDQNNDRRTNAANAGLPANFFVANPAVNQLQVTDSGAYSDYHAFQIDMRRRLSRGLSADVNYQYAIERGSSFDGFSFGRTMTDQGNVRHAFKTQWDWTIPVGRGQRFGANLHPLVDGFLGGWSFNGVGRIQARTINLGNVRLVGMTVDEFTKMYKHDIRIDPSTGLQTVYMLPDDVILNTRRAFSSSATTLTGYSTSLGAPEGRYIAPANSADCIQIRAGDCAPRVVLIRAPWFTRFDIGITKKFPIKGNTNFEVRFDVLNVFDNVNFNLADTDSRGPGTAANIFQIAAAYTDPSNTYDPGGRLGQLMFRVNW